MARDERDAREDARGRGRAAFWRVPRGTLCIKRVMTRDRPVHRSLLSHHSHLVETKTKRNEPRDATTTRAPGTRRLGRRARRRSWEDDTGGDEKRGRVPTAIATERTTGTRGNPATRGGEVRRGDEKANASERARAPSFPRARGATGRVDLTRRRDVSNRWMRDDERM